MHPDNKRRLTPAGGVGVVNPCPLRGRISMGVAVAAFSLLLLVACGAPLSLSNKYEIYHVQARGRAITTPVLLVADNQLNHLYGDPMWMVNSTFDKVVRVTLRPVAQDIFAPDLLRAVLEDVRPSRVIHLGDATNVACLGEFQRFAEVMKAPAVNGWRWVMAPGNHDFYLLGNSATNPLEWQAACNRAGGPMQKNRFIVNYLKLLKAQFPHFERYLRSQHGAEIPESDEWSPSRGHYVNDPHPFLRALAWHIDHEAPHRSFILQEMNLGRPGQKPPVSMVLLDTNQYWFAPTLVPLLLTSNAGLNGDLGTDQKETARRWMDRAANPDRIFFLAGHHPYKTLRSGARSAIDDMRVRFGVPMYLSAHTHKGGYLVNGDDPSTSWLELNMGSITDWPIEYRTFTVGAYGPDDSKLQIRASLFRLPEDFGKKWSKLCSMTIPAAMDEDSFVVWERRNSLSKQETVKQKLRDALLVYRRSFDKLKTDDANVREWPAGCGGSCAGDSKIIAEIDRLKDSDDRQTILNFLSALDRFDAVRPVQVPPGGMTKQQFRWCLAVEAAKFDRLRRYQPVVQDEFIVVPKAMRGPNGN